MIAIIILKRTPSVGSSFNKNNNELRGGVKYDKILLSL
jgi:hypothetical protein